MDDQREVFAKLIIPIGTMICFLGGGFFLWSYFYKYQDDPNKSVILIIAIINFLCALFGISTMKKNRWFPFK